MKSTQTNGGHHTMPTITLLSTYTNTGTRILGAGEYFELDCSCGHHTEGILELHHGIGEPVAWCGGGDHFAQLSLTDLAVRMPQPKTQELSAGRFSSIMMGTA